MPRYKVRNEGDHVRFHDQVTFESVKMPGRFLNSSDVEFKRGVYRGEREIDLSTRMCSFTVLGNFSPQDHESQNSQAVKGCDVVCFYHKELDSYLAAEGSFIEPDVVEEPHLHQRYKSAISDTKLVATNATFYWQVEVEGESLRGEPILWVQGIKLKHLPTQRYLCFHGGVLSLTTDSGSKAAVFRFRPIVKTGLHVENGASCTLEHRLTGKLIHGDCKRSLFTVALNPPAKGTFLRYSGGVRLQAE